MFTILQGLVDDRDLKGGTLSCHLGGLNDWASLHPLAGVRCNASTFRKLRGQSLIRPGLSRVKISILDSRTCQSGLCSDPDAPIGSYANARFYDKGRLTYCSQIMARF